MMTPPNADGPLALPPIRRPGPPRAAEAFELLHSGKTLRTVLTFE
jgi:hypothetical protein